MKQRREAKHKHDLKECEPLHSPPRSFFSLFLPPLSAACSGMQSCSCALLLLLEIAKERGRKGGRKQEKRIDTHIPQAHSAACVSSLTLLLFVSIVECNCECSAGGGRVALSGCLSLCKSGAF